MGKNNKKSDAAPEVKGATNTKPTDAEKREAAAAKKQEAEAKKAAAKAEKDAAAKKRNEEREAKKAAKAKEKAEKAKPKIGVIHEIGVMLARKEGASKKEIVEHLSAKFPEKDAEKMATTVGIQITRLPSIHGFELKRTKDETEGGRGLVYKAPAALVGMIEKRSIRQGRQAEA